MTIIRFVGKKLYFRAMKIVLLSGGSGKRLWPLSNNARSKQFLPLLNKPGGGMESMQQRVVRQIFEARLTESITIATNASQRDIIINQLGELTDIVTEPERRDTFPAIALATAYLAFEKGCSADETVVIMPCDPYTESGYFDTVRTMAQVLESGTADMVLMGITPTYPSTKFGYVVPEPSTQSGCAGAEQNGNPNRAGALKVKRFTEKPSVEKAEGLLSEGALWNGGIFAFKLGYMTGILRMHINTDSFEEVFRNYGKLPKISFDYEVAEKAESVAVVPYNGEWKDLGTWNALTAALDYHTLGNATLGPDCTNVHAINELNIPLFVNGIDNAIVAASPDGILVCDKEKSEALKSFVDPIATRPMYEERRWGTYRVLDNTVMEDGVHSLTKIITLKAGKSISYQLHNHRSETWNIIEGEGVLVLNGEVRKVKRGDVVTIPCGYKHTIKAYTQLSFVEVQLGRLLTEDDIDRFDFDWSLVDNR